MINGRWVKLRGGKGVLLATGVTHDGRRAMLNFVSAKEEAKTRGFL